MKAVENVIAIIPAREGSKGVPGKNIKMIGGKPLIAWTIEAAKQSSFISRVIVTSDSTHIGEIARAYGAETPFVRPKQLAEDSTPMSDVIRHTLDHLHIETGRPPDSFVLLQPTTPLRTARHIDEAAALFHKLSCDAVVSVCEVKEHPYLMKRIVGNELRNLLEDGLKYSRRQDYPKIYKLNGSIFVYRTEAFMEENASGNSTMKYVPYIMKYEDSIDIDTPLDFEIARACLIARK